VPLQLTLRACQRSLLPPANTLHPILHHVLEVVDELPLVDYPLVRNCKLFSCQELRHESVGSVFKDDFR